MDETRSLAADIRRVRNAAARELTVDQRLSTGYALFEQWLDLVRSDVLADDPHADDVAVEQEIERRLRIARRRDGTGRNGQPIYRDA